MQILLRQVKDLPSLPDVAVKVARTIDKPTTSANDVARVLSMDQGLTARVLRLANSVFYGATRRISTVSDAIVLLGMRTVRNLAMASSVEDVLGRELAGYAMQRGELWRHSCGCANVAQSLATLINYPVPEEAFVAGLLHDVGKVLLSVHMQVEFSGVLKLTEDEDISFMEAEQRILGFDHAEVGACVLERWNLPTPLVQAVRYHHTPMAQSEFSKLTALVHVADVICVMMGIGVGGDGLRYALDREAQERLGLSDEQIERQISDLSDLGKESTEILR
ncbi:phosphohydrolase [Capsulimonas corticalis]|uniref:Phosphohydrolase n=2 Tax=Capsulimonas corticalis TaxID=2219043 RepID=A0A402CXR0_9BACT|nr:phosphohydrolase [Capsulimonas corticalis]